MFRNLCGILIALSMLTLSACTPEDNVATKAADAFSSYLESGSPSQITTPADSDNSEVSSLPDESGDTTASEESSPDPETESNPESGDAEDEEILPLEPDDTPTASSPNAKQGARDNTPVSLVPTAPGTILYENEKSAIDASNASEGYIMVKYKESNAKVKLQMKGPDGVTYTYNLSDTWEAFPLSAGNGNYSVTVLYNISGKDYYKAQSVTLEVNITNIYGPNLYPNQYCDFTADSLTVNKGKELAKMANTDLDVVTNVYNYIIDNVTYDYDKANTVASGYLTNVDEIYLSNTGICLDYAAVMTSMLRSQRIPTRLEVGYAGDVYHAWISVYLTEIGWVNGIVEFDGVNWKLMDPTFAASSKESTLRNFIGDGSNYALKYVY